MAIPNTCNVCGVTLSSKSNLNKHVDLLHSTPKKNALKKTHKRQRSKLQLTKKKPASDINVEVLNEVLWDLLLSLIEQKNPTVIQQ